MALADTYATTRRPKSSAWRAPVYLKFGLRNAQDVYPSGTHLESLVVALSRERVRRAEIGLAHLDRYYPDATTSELGAPALGIPVIT